MNQKLNRRKLVLTKLSDISDEARRLLASGYVATGKWNLAQACNHINEWVRYPVDGYPPVPFYCRPVFWVLRNTIMPGKLKQYIAEGSFPAGKPTMPQTVFAADACSDEEAVRKLAATIERVGDYRSPLHASPLFGNSDRESHLGMQLVHAAHHLSFLIPKGS